MDLKPKQLNETFDLPQSETQPDVVSPPEVAEVPKPEVKEAEPEAVIPPPEEEPLPPAPKGAYNLDFLDNLDDPNFNPFETKTKVENKFETKSDSSPKIEKVEKPIVEESANQKTENDSDQLNLDFEPPKRAPPKLGQNRPKKAIKGGQKPAPKPPAPKVVEPEPKPADVEPDLPAEEQDMPLPAKGAYNFDFDKFDDPNFNPFETKTKVVNKFEEKDPIAAPKPEVVPEVKEVEPKPEVIVEKPKAEMMDVGNDDLSELNTAMEPPKRAPPKLGQRRPPAKKKTAPAKKAPPPKPATPPPPADAEDEEPLPPAPKGAYNLDFLDNLDDPNFNPFETKTKVENKFDEKIETKQPDLPKEQPTKAQPEVQSEKPEVPSEKPDVASENLDELNVDFEPPKRAPPKLGQRRPPVKKKVKKVVKPEVTKEPEADDAPIPAKGAYAVDFDKFDDPNYNPFETKSKVSNQEPANPEPDLPKPKAGGYNLDFLDNLDDPNFNPFETKSKVENKPVSSANEKTITPTQSKPEESSPVKLEPEIPTEPPTQQKSKFLDYEIF